MSVDENKRWLDTSIETVKRLINDANGDQQQIIDNLSSYYNQKINSNIYLPYPSQMTDKIPELNEKIGIQQESVKGFDAFMEMTFKPTKKLFEDVKSKMEMYESMQNNQTSDVNKTLEDLKEQSSSQMGLNFVSQLAFNQKYNNMGNNYMSQVDNMIESYIQEVKEKQNVDLSEEDIKDSALIYSVSVMTMIPDVLKLGDNFIKMILDLVNMIFQAIIDVLDFIKFIDKLTGNNLLSQGI